MSDFTIYHNPRCSKSRQTLALLKEHNIDPAVVPYMDSPPSVDKLKELIHQLGISARDLLRKNESLYKELGLNDPELGEDQLLRAMADNPRLMERPIVVKGERAVLGRPPENVLELIQ